MIRICVLTANNEPACFMDNDAPEALHYYNDTLHTFLAGSAYTFEFTSPASHPDVEFLAVGNKLAFVDENERRYYLNISQTEQDEDQIMVTAMGLSFELINENAPAYTATSAMTFAQYMSVMGYNSNVIQIGTNEISNLSRTGEWESNTETRLARLFSLASLFEAELEFVPQLNRDYSLNKIILNIYRAHNDQYQGMGRVRDDIRLRYGVDVSSITRKADISNLYTQIYPTGKDGLTISSKAETIYDDNGNVLYQTTLGENAIRAVQARDQFPSNTSVVTDKYITYYWSTDYETVNDLYGNALAKLKEISKPAVEYEISGYADLQLGDTVTITDEAFNPSLYLEVRVTEQERSFTEPERNTTRFDNVTELTSQISGDLAAQIEELQAQVSAAQATANTAAQTAATAEQTASSASQTATAAQQTATAAQSDATQALSDASDAASAASAAQGDATQALSDASAAASAASSAASAASAAQTTANTAAQTASSASQTATAAQTTANAASQAVAEQSAYFFHDNAGAHVTSTSGDATTGNNVLIDADSVDIRDGTDVVASFGANLVEIGKNSQSSAIEMCNGLMHIGYNTSLNMMDIYAPEDSDTMYLRLILPISETSLTGSSPGIELFRSANAMPSVLTVNGNNLNINAYPMEQYGSGTGGMLSIYAPTAATLNGYQIMTKNDIKMAHDWSSNSAISCATNANTTLHNYTTTEDGLYLVSFTAQISGTSGTGRYDCYVNTQRNGSTQHASFAQVTFPKSHSYPCISATGTVECTAGDVIHWYTWCNTAYSVSYRAIQIVKLK